MKNKSVQNCRFVHHAKFHCIMSTLNRLFEIEFKRGETGKEPKKQGDLGRIKRLFSALNGKKAILMCCGEQFLIFRYKARAPTLVSRFAR